MHRHLREGVLGLAAFAVLAPAATAAAMALRTDQTMAAHAAGHHHLLRPHTVQRRHQEPRQVMHISTAHLETIVPYSRAQPTTA